METELSLQIHLESDRVSQDGAQQDSLCQAGGMLGTHPKVTQLGHPKRPLEGLSNSEFMEVTGVTFERDKTQPVGGEHCASCPAMR